MITNAILIALRQIMRNFLRSFLTIIGIVIGVASVISMVNFGKATSQNITQSIASLGSNLLIIFPSKVLDSRGVSEGRIPFSQREVDFLSSRIQSKIRAISPVSNTSALAQYAGKNVLTKATGIGEQYLQATNSQIAQGREFTSDEFSSHSRVCIIGNSVKKALYDTNPLGSNLKIGSFVCEVIGILKEKGQGATGEDQDDVILVPLKTFNAQINSNASIHNIKRVLISLKDGVVSQDMIPEILQILREARGVREGQKTPFEVLDTKEILQAVNSTTKMMTIFITTIASISLFVGGIGIMNMMLISVSERTREIGIRIAIGATSFEVLLQFLIESIVLSVLGGFLGVLISFGLSYALMQYFQIPFVYDKFVVFYALGFCVLIGILFGYLPARKASKLNPIEALRYE